MWIALLIHGFVLAVNSMWHSFLCNNWIYYSVIHSLSWVFFVFQFYFFYNESIINPVKIPSSLTKFFIASFLEGHKSIFCCTDIYVMKKRTISNAYQISPQVMVSKENYMYYHFFMHMLITCISTVICKVSESFSKSSGTSWFPHICTKHKHNPYLKGVQSVYIV